MKKVSDITVCRDDYKSKEDFENAVKRVVMVLLENGYIMTVKYDEPSIGIVWIHYDYASESLGGYEPVWLSPDEFDSVKWDDEKIEDDDTSADKFGCGVKIRIPHGDDLCGEIVLTEAKFQKCDNGVINVYIPPENIEDLISALKYYK